MKKKVYIILNCLIVTIVTLVTLYFTIWQVPSTEDVFNKSQYSVVELKSTTIDGKSSYGSAVFIDKDGTLVTNAHLIIYKQAGEQKEFATFEIRFSFEEEYRSVSLIKYDIHNDIAVLKIDNLNANFKAIKICSRKAYSGQKVYAVGNGLNHGIGINEGIVSIPEVDISYNDSIKRVIQCDLIINEGNSGGALLNEKGELIGITTFRLKDDMGNVIYGVGYCISITQVISFMV